MTCWKKLHEWQGAGVWGRLQHVLVQKLEAADKTDWARGIIDSSSVRAVHGATRPVPASWIVPRSALSFNDQLHKIYIPHSIHALLWCFIAMPLARPCIELLRNRIALLLRQRRHALPL